MYKFLIPLFALAILVGCTGQPPEGQKSDSPTDSMKEDTNELMGFDGEFLTGKHTAILHTSKGDIEVELDADAAPKTVTNFVLLAQSGYYDGLTFHRVIPDFMIQGGDPNGNGTGGESVFGESFEDEINADSYGLDEKPLSEYIQNQPLPEELKDASVKDFYEAQGYAYNDKLKSLPMDRGALAMANRGPNTNGSQFFIIQREDGTPWLDGKHTVFGQVTKGLDIVDAIATAPRNAQDLPNEPITYTVEIKE